MDISELVQRDANSGIQRVVRSILKQLVDFPPEGFRVEPVYATTDQGYRYARRFILRFLGCPDSVLTDDAIEFRAGDVFLGLDLQPEVVPAQQTFYQRLRNSGVPVYFAVYDMLPVTLSNAFPLGLVHLFKTWLQVVAESDGVVCISKTVATEIAEWLKENGPVRQRPFKINWFSLGADLAVASPMKGKPGTTNGLLKSLANRPSFLMVGTLEPRKGYAQTLGAFEKLWGEGIEANLVIVGKQGWMVEDLIDKLRASRFLGKQLHWLESISDECLETLYRTSSALLAASEGEGFGLPLIEAARHNLPVIARDIQVFRESAGEHAFYFSGKKPEDLANAIKQWLDLYSRHEMPRSDNMPWITWEASARQLIDIIFNRTGANDLTLTYRVRCELKKPAA